MQNGSLMKSKRQNGQTVWEFRWRDRTSGRAIYRRIVVGTTQRFENESEARAAVAGIVLEINAYDRRPQTRVLTISQLAEHYRRRELAPDNTWKTYSTKKCSHLHLTKKLDFPGKAESAIMRESMFSLSFGYENYLNRWIVPKW